MVLYEKSIAFKFKQWLDGTKEMYVDNVEMKPAKEHRETKATEQIRKKEKKSLLMRVHDVKNNKEIVWFNKLYNVFSIIFCLFLVTLLLIATSYLPSFGEKDNPVNNEVSNNEKDNTIENSNTTSQNQEQKETEKMILLSGLTGLKNLMRYCKRR